MMEIAEGRSVERSRDVMVPRRNDLPVNPNQKDGASHKKELLSQFKKSQNKEDISGRA